MVIVDFSELVVDHNFEVLLCCHPLNDSRDKYVGCFQWIMSSSNTLGDLLLVEDNPGDVRLTREMLKEDDLDPSVHVVSDGDEALDYLHQQGEFSDAPRPDVILLDLHLPRMDGDDVLEEMDNSLSDIPVIVLSGSRDGADLKLDDVRDKVDACMVKPLDPECLREFFH